MKKVETPELYKKWHVDRDYELVSLFEQVAERYSIESVLYPGCYVHITPSFFIPKAVYVDMEKPAMKFFGDPNVLPYIESRKTYTETPSVTFYHQSYENNLSEPEESFDLLVSQYVGFVSESTKKYLKKGGYLLVNNSHGDAGLVSLDPNFELVAVANCRDGKFTISDKELSLYFLPKKKTEVTAEYLKEMGRGVAYTKTATNYIFRKAL